jgi:hypothetical protein
VHVPKTGGTSIEKSDIFRSVRATGHATALDFRESYPEKFDQYFKFSFVRNPYSRLLSAYLYLSKGGSGNRHDSEVFKKYFENTNHDFEFFCKSIVSKDVISDVVHFRPQHNFLFDNDKKLLVDFVGRQETYSRDARTVFNKLGVNYRPKHLRKNGVYKHFSEYYTVEIQEKVFQLYKEDFELLNYPQTLDGYNKIMFPVKQFIANTSSSLLASLNKTKSGLVVLKGKDIW